MSNKNLMRLVLILVVVVIAWGIAALVRHERTDRRASLTLPAIDTSAVDTMALRSATDTSVVARGADGLWRVNGHRASAATVNSALSALVDTTNWSELVSRSASSHASMGVTPDSGTLFHVAVRNGTGYDLLAGHPVTSYEGVFVRRPADSAVYALHGPLSQIFSRKEDAWRDRTIASVMPSAVARVEIQRGRTSFALVRTGARWIISTTSATADSATVGSFLGRFHPLEAIGFASATQSAPLNFSKPYAELRFYAGSGGTPTTVLRVDSTKTGVWIEADTSSTVYGIESWDLAQLAPKVQSFTRPPVAVR